MVRLTHLYEAWITDAMKAAAPRLKGKLRKSIPPRYMAGAMFKSAKKASARGGHA